ncbi:GNAT family N-acetyltransferase [Neptunicella sp.]|uniref:GNAT family N-acetyltransferase n=1 Tax=Neptunicella sp. TaxID=2125986 RepID=UPI003F691A64
MKVRVANLADAKTLSLIEQQCFVTDQIPPRQMRYLLNKAKAQTWLMELDGQIVGYCMALMPNHPRSARLYSIAVLAEYRGKRIANQLIEAMLRELKQRGYSKVRLEVRCSQHKVQSLYQQFGFVTVAELAEYYADNESAFRMEKAL